MNKPRPPASRRWTRTAVIAVATLLAGVAVAPGTATAAPAVTDACPEPFPVAELAVGMTATGYTVERGTTAEPFEVSILGVITDGIAPGIDMIVADTESPAIERAGGIWAGMSGSPVYAEDGRLIGAVGYGFSTSPSPIAGITPAAAMYRVLDRPSAVPVTEVEEVAIPAALGRTMTRTAGATSTQLAGGLSPLPLPVSVSGLSRSRLAAFSERVGDSAFPGGRFVAASAATGGGASTPADIFPGSNFAAADSYGDLTAAGVGTTTAVCGDRVLAFGHPAALSGASSMSIHAADAVVIQRDNTLGSFKLANPLGVVGRLDQDRTAAIAGTLGAGPPVIPVTSVVTDLDDGGSRDGATQVVTPAVLPEVAAFHLLSNFDAVHDRVGGGTTKVRWVIDGRRAGGAPFQVDVTNRYADTMDVTYESIFDSYLQLEALAANPFDDVRITGVHYQAEASSEYTRYSVGTVQRQQPDGSYRTVRAGESLTATTGSRLNLRVTLEPYRNVGAPRQVDLSVPVPPGTAGGYGTLDIFGGPGYDDEAEPRTFDALLAELNGAVTNDTVTAALSVEAETASGYTTKRASARATVDRVVVGEQSFEVQVVAAPRSKPAVVDGKTWKLRNSASAGKPNRSFNYGDSNRQQLMCDWNGDGKTSPALFKDGSWWVRMTATTTSSRTFTFGTTGDKPVCGDWNGDGRDQVGLFRSGRWLLRGGVHTGPVIADFAFGGSAWRPVAGDWNGDGIDTVGVYRKGEWRLRNAHQAGAADHAFTYGRSGDLPVTGDWNRDGRDQPGLYRAGTWYLRPKLTSGSSAKFSYGVKSSRPVVWY